MHVDSIPLFTGLLIFAASIISLRLGISVAIVEILLGSIAGNFGLRTEPWMQYLAGFGGIILTFLAGTEIDTKMMKKTMKESLLIGGMSFLVPFVAAGLTAYFLLHWNIRASLIAGIALSTTSLAVVYSVLIESGLSDSRIGKLLMSSTFITDMGTALALSVIFVKPTWSMLLFYVVSIVIIIVASRDQVHFPLAVDAYLFRQSGGRPCCVAGFRAWFVHVQIFWQTIGTSCSDTTAPYRCIRHNNADFFHCRRTQDFFSAYCGEHRSFSVVFLPKNNRKIPRSLLSGKIFLRTESHLFFRC